MPLDERLDPGEFDLVVLADDLVHQTTVFRTPYSTARNAAERASKVSEKYVRISIARIT
jgi:hypothetical protein